MIVLCHDCGKQMYIVKAGRVVVEMRRIVGEQQKAYRLWNADILGCSKCGYSVIAGFAERPYAREGDEGFETMAQTALATGAFAWLD